MHDTDLRSHSPLSAPAVLTCLVLALLVPALPVWSEDGRDFAGFYELVDPVVQSDGVRLTFELQLFNYSGDDARDIVLTIEERTVPDQVVGTLSTSFLAYRAALVLTGNITVSLGEFEQWQKGAPPSLRIGYFDASGQPRETQVELIAMSVETGE